ncbi:MAG: murein L,D-transpeptidase [Bdellovibrionaceae bacterium]|nr:murein L,D-transpeptidase [Bdellovibrionales bacterium]MCB9083012.1 murein L,D-transpeptidase [Pseudobdellovibrionaceae bacterium]
MKEKNSYFLLILTLITLLLGLHLFKRQALGQSAILPTSPLSLRVRHQRELGLKKTMGDRGLQLGSEVFLRAFKHSRVLEVWIKKEEAYELFKTHPICYFSGYAGPKTKKGDQQVPEGIYAATPQRMNPFSSYHLSFNIGYPNALDRALGRTGGSIMVHGDCVSLGCLAMTNKGIEEIYTILEASFLAGHTQVPIHIFPFRMNLLNRWRYIRYDWQDFWSQLSPIYDYFEEHRQVPSVKIENGRYLLEENQ